jgi:nitrate/nitrite transport system ATP-binding protein
MTRRAVVPTLAPSCLQVIDLSVAFPTPTGRYVAVENINLDVARGEIVSLIGHSGCGKSTVLNVIGGLVRPTAGEVLLTGRRIDGPGPDRGLVFQHYSLLPWLSVWANVYEAVDAVLTDRASREKAELVEDVLRMVHLWDHREKLPSQISGGMKQRAAIARAFAIHPQVLLLDEPFGALDALTRASLQEELLNLWSLDNRTETVVLVTHDIDEAIFLSDRIVVMSNGPAATIGEILHVPLPRPRDKRELLHSPEYVELRERLLDLLLDAHTSRQRAPERALRSA